VAAEAANSVKEVDPNSGCDATWSAEASDPVIQQDASFAPICRVQYLGAGAMPGIPCLADTDCQPGKTCNLATLLCNHTEADVRACWVANMPQEVQYALFNFWGISAAPDPVSLDANIGANAVVSGCTGPGSILYRPHWHFQREQLGCYDGCFDGAGVDLEPRCFETDAAYCPIPPLCDQTILVNNCFRRWVCPLLAVCPVSLSTQTFVQSENTGQACNNAQACNYPLTNCSGRVGQTACFVCQRARPLYVPAHSRPS
jgi:hypothetical protein